MIYKFDKYKDIHDYINNIKKSKSSNEYTILHKCKGIDISSNPPTLLDKCFGCLFCVFSSNDMQKQYSLHWGDGTISIYAREAFKGNIIKMPFAKNSLKNPNKTLEYFTSTAETSNIQPWAAGIVNHICTAPNRIGMEVHVPNIDYDRDGRLDICSITDFNLLVMESKTSLDDALKDERFVEQHTKYTIEIMKSSNNFTYLTLIGGKETDLLPESDSHCTGKIGGKSSRFYDIVIKNNIQFISANALWCLACKYITYGNDYAWDMFLTDLFSNENCIGLISSGKVILNSNNIVEVKPI